MRSARIASLLAALAFAAPALAAGERKPAKEADLGKKKTSQTPDTSLAGSIKAKGTEAAEAKGPTLAFDTFRYAIEGQVSEKRRDEIADLQKLIQLGGTEAEMPGWLFRLAELYWEESQYYGFEANRKDDEIIRLGGAKADPTEVERLKGEQKELHAKSKSYQGEAIARYQEIVKKYKKYSRLDEVLFFLGENLSRNQKQKEALGIYKLLITNFPKSKFVPDAWMAFGEYYFNTADKGNRNENLGKALEAYKKAASYTESTVYGYAMYKQAWVYYNLGQWGEALDLFKAVIFFGDLPTSTIAQDKKLALVKEARKDYVRTYSHVGSPSAAKDDFKKVGGEANWWDMLKGLAQLYYDEGKDKEAILVYRVLINEKSLSPEAPLFQSRVVTCAGRIGNKRYTVEQSRLFVKLLHDIEKSGMVKDEKGKKALDDARNDAENTLRTLAVQYHNEYKKTRDDQTALMANEVYQDYLAVFPDTGHSYEMRFFFAELLYALEKYERAGDEYSRVAIVDIKKVDPTFGKKKAGEGADKAAEKPPEEGAEGGEAAEAKPAEKPAAKQKPGKYMKDALESAVFSYDEVVKKFEETEKKAAGGDPKQKLPIPKPKQKLLAASERYLKYIPRGDKYVEIAYKAANIHYRYNYFEESNKRFTDIALNHPKHELSGYSANLVLDSFNILADWKGVNEWARKFYASAELIKAHPQLKDDLVKVIEESSFKLVEGYEKDKAFTKAAQAYVAFVKEWPRSSRAPQALFNGSIMYFNSHRLDKAVELREALVKAYPTHALAPKCVYANGESYEAVADFEKSADFYERYYNEWAKSSGKGKHKAVAKAKPKAKKGEPEPSGPPAVYEEQKAQDALYNAAIFRDGLKQYARAIKDREEYLDTWPTSKEAPKLFLTNADTYAKEKAYPKEIKQLEEYQKKYAKDPNEWLATQYRIAKLFEKVKNHGAEKKAYEQALAYYKLHRPMVKDKGMPVVAQAMYLSLEPEFADFDKIKMNVSPKQLKSQLELKGKKFAALDKKYKDVVALKQAEPAVCSLYRIGLGYKHFAQTLYDAPVPKELRTRPELVDEYKNQLSAFGQVPEQKAVEGLELAMQSARQYAINNECAQKASELLLKYKPEKYGPPQEAFAELDKAAVIEHREGNGLLASLQVIPVASAGDEEGEEAPAVQEKAVEHPPEGEGAAPDNAPPPAKNDPVPVKQPGQGDEDLLP